MARYTAEVAGVARAALRKMRRLAPGACEFVYDNYNALVIGFGPTDRASDARVSIVLYPRLVRLFFLHGVGLADPDHLLEGRGRQVRHIALHTADVLDRPAVRKLVDEAWRRGAAPPGRPGRRRLIIKAVSPRQRPRRPRA